MNFSSSVMTGMGISLGNLEVVTDYLYANSDMYEPELTEIKATISHKPCKPVVKQKPVKPKISTQSIINKFSLVSNRNNKNCEECQADEVVELNFTSIKQEDDFDFSFDDLKTKEEERQESTILATDLMNRIASIQQNDTHSQESVEQLDEVDDLGLNDIEDIDDEPEEDLGLDSIEDIEEEPESEDSLGLDDIDIDDIGDNEEQGNDPLDMDDLDIDDMYGDDEEGETSQEQVKQQLIEKQKQEQLEQQKKLEQQGQLEQQTEKEDEDNLGLDDIDLGDFEDEQGDSEDEFGLDDIDDSDIFGDEEDEPVYEKPKPQSTVQEQIKTKDKPVKNVNDSPSASGGIDFAKKLEEMQAQMQAQIQAQLQEQEARVKAEMQQKLKEQEDKIQERDKIIAALKASGVKGEDLKNNKGVVNTPVKHQATPKETDRSNKKPDVNTNNDVETSLNSKQSEYKRYTDLPVDVLYREVRQTMEEMGGKRGAVDKVKLDEKFGAINIKKLLDKSYLIRFGKGVTTGR